MSWPPPLRQDRFAVGDEVWWNVPVVMDHCRTWSPNITKPTAIIAVKDREPGHNGRINAGHTQLVRVSPNYCPFGDEFDGTWLLPPGIETHNDPAFRAIVAQAIEARRAETERLGAQHESAVPEACANTSQVTVLSGDKT